MIRKASIVFALILILLFSSCSPEYVPVDLENGSYSVAGNGVKITPTPPSDISSPEEPQVEDTAQEQEVSIERTVFLEQSTEIIKYLSVAEGVNELTAFYPVDWAFEVGFDESFRIAVRYPNTEEILQYQGAFTPHVFWLDGEVIEVQLQIYLMDDPKTIVVKSEWITINNPAKPTRVYEGDMENKFEVESVDTGVPPSLKTDLETGKKYIPIPIKWKVSLGPGHYLRFVVINELHYQDLIGELTLIEVLDNYIRIPADRWITYVGWFEIVNYHTNTVVDYTNENRLLTEEDLK